jgi:hypothetical protein
MTDHYDPLDLAGQAKGRRDKQEREKVAALVAAEDIRWLMGSRRGRRLVWGILERTGIFRSSFTGNSETFFREGERNVGLSLMAQIHTHCPESYATMVKEQQEPTVEKTPEQ